MPRVRTTIATHATSAAFPLTLGRETSVVARSRSCGWWDRVHLRHEMTRAMTDGGRHAVDTLDVAIRALGAGL